MAIVYFSSELTRYTGGIEELAVDAPRVLELRLLLAGRFPGMGERLEQLAVALDGQIYNDADYQLLEPSTEIHFVPRLVGG